MSTMSRVDELLICWTRGLGGRIFHGTGTVIYQSLGWAPGQWVGSVIARNGGDTACRDGRARGQQPSPSPLLKYLCQTRFRNQAVLLTTRRSSPSLRLCFSFFGHGPKMD